MAPNVVGHEQV